MSILNKQTSQTSPQLVILLIQIGHLLAKNALTNVFVYGPIRTPNNIHLATDSSSISNSSYDDDSGGKNGDCNNADGENGDSIFQYVDSYEYYI